MTIADPEAAALLRAVLLNPGDDTPRLVYADRLDDLGEHDRAHFIRVQCELAKTPQMVMANRLCHQRDWEAIRPAVRKGMHFRLSAPADRIGVLKYPTVNSQWVALHDRGEAIMRRHWVEWCRPCPVPSVRESAETLALHNPPTFTRGFVSRIELPLAAFMEHAAGMFVVHPITEVRLTDCRIERPNGPYVWFTNIGMDRLPGPPADTNWLPWSIARHLVFDGPAQYYPGFVRHERGYATNGAANAALSTACVTFGRSLAGLAAAAA